MPSAQKNLRTLVEELPLVIVNLNTAIANIDETTRTLLDQQQAIEGAVFDLMVSAASGFMVDWAISLDVTYTVTTSGDWGNYSESTGNLTEWSVINPDAGQSGENRVQYQGFEITSAGPQADNAEARQYDRQNEWTPTYEHIHDPLGVTPGTYGIVEKITALERGRTLQVNNEAKYTEVLKIYDDYTGSPPVGA
jgi:hypothetical protein